MAREQAIPLSVYEKKISRRSFFGIAKDTVIGDVKTLHKTAGEAALYTFFIGGPLTALTKGLGVASMQILPYSTKEDPLCRLIKPEILPLLIGIGPAAEEITTRLLPGTLLAKNWRVGIFSSLGFAYLHHTTDFGFSKQGVSLDVDFTKIPIDYFASGLYLWKVFKDRGFLHSVVAHSTINSIAAIAGAIRCRN